MCLVDRFHETNRIRWMELKPTDLILRRREAPSRRMAAGSVSLVAVLRDARKSALLRTRLAGAQDTMIGPDWWSSLLPDAEIPEDDIQDVFHIHAAQELAERPRRQPQLL